MIAMVRSVFEFSTCSFSGNRIAITVADQFLEHDKLQLFAKLVDYCDAFTISVGNNGERLFYVEFSNSMLSFRDSGSIFSPVSQKPESPEIDIASIIRDGRVKIPDWLVPGDPESIERFIHERSQEIRSEALARKSMPRMSSLLAWSRLRANASDFYDLVKSDYVEFEEFPPDLTADSASVSIEFYAEDEPTVRRLTGAKKKLFVSMLESADTAEISSYQYDGGFCIALHHYIEDVLIS